MTKKALIIISLIKDDLTNIRLVKGIENLGFHCDQYHLRLSETVFMLIGFKNDNQEERFYEEYTNVSRKVLSIDILKHPEKLEAMAISIYELLIRKKKLQQLKNQKHGKR